MLELLILYIEDVLQGFSLDPADDDYQRGYKAAIDELDEWLLAQMQAKMLEGDDLA